jgi:CBS domain-containing protein
MSSFDTRTTTSPNQPASHLCQDLARHIPFSRMAAEDVARFVARAKPVDFAASQDVLGPASGPVEHLYCVCQGSVTGRHGLAEAAGGFQYEAGDLFPVGAAMGHRPVTATYTADVDTVCLMLPAAEMQALAAECTPFADFLNRRIVQFLEVSRQAVQAHFASQTLAQQSLEAPLGTLPRKQAASVGPQASLTEALTLMHERRIGSVLVTSTDGLALGILTRHDVLGRVTLPQLPLSTPIERVMSAPLHSLTTAHTAHEAALLMSRHGIRHLPVTEDGRVVNIVSERDLFALQRLSLKHVSSAIRAASDVDTVRMLAGDIRRFARNLLAQGVQARQLTELISNLNDVLAAQLVDIIARITGVDMTRACWVAFGSEGRGEQTISTDQDNGLVFVSEEPTRDRPQWLAFARQVNEALDACGYPLCKGQIMASNPACCLSVEEWRSRFSSWMEQGAPEDLLNASIFFDLRPVAGRLDLATPLRALITERAAALPRFMKQLALNALRHRPPLNWRGAIDSHKVGGRDVIDLKLQGTAIFVDAARIYALAQGIAETGTRARLEAFADRVGLDHHESDAWVRGFEFLQSLRLTVQLDADSRESVVAPDGNANLVDVGALNDIDRRVLREALRVARRLQQRMELDYQR